MLTQMCSVESLGDVRRKWIARDGAEAAIVRSMSPVPSIVCGQGSGSPLIRRRWRNGQRVELAGYVGWCPLQRQLLLLDGLPGILDFHTEDLDLPCSGGP